MRHSLRATVREARKQKKAILHCNVGSFEQLEAVARVALRLDAPVIVGVSEGERAYLGVRRVSALVSSYNEEFGSPEKKFHLFLNADHTHSIEKAEEAAEAGFDAVLFDRGKLPFEENLRETREAVRRVRAVAKRVLIEGELGYIGASSEVFESLPEGAAIDPETLTTPEEAKRFTEETEIDLLAPAVGNVHGRFQSAPNPNLDQKRIARIRRAARVPLVLHGGSGIPDVEIIAAVRWGMAIVHIGTDFRIAWKSGLERALERHAKEIAPYKILSGVVDSIETVVERYVRLVGGET